MSMLTMDSVEVIVDNGSPVVIKPINTTKTEGGEAIKAKQTTATNTQPKMSPEELVSFQEYINSDHFKNKVLEISKAKGIPPVTLAKSFVNNTLGTIGDTGVSAINTVEELVDNVTDLLANLIKGVNKTSANFAKNTIRTVTLGKTVK